MKHMLEHAFVTTSRAAWMLAALIILILTPVKAQEAGTPYTDPQGRFTLTIPTDWTVTEAQDALEFIDPDKQIKLYSLISDDTDLKTAIADAWIQVNADFSLKIDTAEDAPGFTEGMEKSLQVAYISDQPDTKIYRAIAGISGARTYIFLLDASLEGVQRRLAQVQIILTSLKITGVENISLKGVTPALFNDTIGQELSRYIQDTLATAGIPGVAVAVVQNGKLVYSRGFGVATLGDGTPITPDTSMMIGSTGKSLTTMLLARLVDEGRFTWDTPVIDVLPQFKVSDPELTRTITIRNLVCACTGVPRRDIELLFNSKHLTAESVVESLASFKFFTKFGEAFQYSNQMVGTAGYAAAAATGATYGQLMAGYEAALQSRVLDPIGMTHTTLDFDTVHAWNNYATPHAVNLLTGAYTPFPMDEEKALSPIAPAGSHWSTANDMALYLITQLNDGVAPDGTTVVSAKNLNITREPQVAVDAQTHYGLGWFIEDYFGQTLINHGGNTFGFTSDAAFLPEAQIGIIVLSNGGGTNAFNVSIRTRMLELVFGLDAKSEKDFALRFQQTQDGLTKLRAGLGQALDEAAVTPFLGTYTNEALGDATLALKDGILTLDVGDFVTRLVPYQDADGKPVGYMTLDVAATGSVIELVKKDDGAKILAFGTGLERYEFTPKP